MKKLLFITSLAIAVAVIFSSCTKKDGVFNPKNKISKVYEQWSGEQKELTEKWTWDGNLLTKVEEYWDGELESTLRYKYDGKRMVEITNTDGMVAKIKYDGNKFEKIEVYIDSFLWLTMEFKYTKNHISQIDYTQNEVEEFMAKPNLRIIKGLIPESSYNELVAIEREFMNNRTKGVQTWSSTFTFDGKNVKTQKTIYPSGVEYTYTMTYDKANNPYYGNVFAGDFQSFSKNNVVKYTTENNQAYFYEIEYDYVYENNFPTEVSYVSNGYTHTTFYTYE